MVGWYAPEYKNWNAMKGDDNREGKEFKCQFPWLPADVPAVYPTPFSNRPRRTYFEILTYAFKIMIFIVSRPTSDVNCKHVVRIGICMHFFHRKSQKL
jgi:hypothetical protein